MNYALNSHELSGNRCWIESVKEFLDVIPSLGQ